MSAEEVVTSGKRTEIDRYLVEKSLPLGLWRFATPYMLAFMLQALYGAVDLLIVGRYCNEAAIAAVSTGAQLLQALTGLVLGLSAGGTALIAFNVGAKDSEGAASAVGTTSTLFSLVALIVTPLFALSTDWLVELMQTPSEAVEYTRQYVFVIACGIPFIIGYNIIGAIYRGFGDSATPTIFVAIACVLNIIGDYVLVAQFGRGPEGAALATIVSQGASLALALWYMRVKRFAFEFHRRHFKLRRKSVVKILAVGAPLALQDALTGFSFLVILAIVNLMGVMPAAGMGIAQRVIGFLFLPPIAFSIAVVTAAAQNIGAGHGRRAFMAFVYGALFSLGFGVLFWTLCQFFPTEFSRVFTDMEPVAAHSALYLRSFTIDCLCVAFIFNCNGYFCGCGKSLVVLVHSAIAALAARIPLSYFLSRGDDATLYEVGFAAPIASVISIIICVGYFLYLWKRGAVDVKG